MPHLDATLIVDGRSLVWKGERFVVAPSGHLEKEVSPPG